MFESVELFIVKYIEFIGLLDFYRLIKIVCDDFSTQF